MPSKNVPPLWFDRTFPHPAGIEWVALPEGGAGLSRVAHWFEGPGDGGTRYGSDTKLHRVLLDLNPNDPDQIAGFAQFFGPLDGEWDGTALQDRRILRDWGPQNVRVKTTPPLDWELWSWNVARLQFLVKLWDAVRLARRAPMSTAERARRTVTEIARYRSPLMEGVDTIHRLAWRGTVKTLPIERLKGHPLYTACGAGMESDPRGRPLDREARQSYCIEHDHGESLLWQKAPDGTLVQGETMTGERDPATYVRMAEGFLSEAFNTTAGVVLRVRLDPLTRRIGWEPIGPLGVLYAHFYNEIAGEPFAEYVTCAGCRMKFVPHRKGHKCCSETCRVAAHRDRKAADKAARSKEER